MKGIAVIFLILAASLAYAADRSVVVKEKTAAGAIEKERKTALVIGNSTYISSPLKNPANDAKAMAKALRELGFTVDERTNLNQNEMKLSIESFGKAIKQGGVGLFFYAGHGMQVDGRNYLIPVDADIQGEAEVDIKAVDAGAVLAKMDMAQNVMNIVILDACRNNPFARSYRAANPGLASMNAPSGTLIAYATAPGSVASDGTGANGLYTQEVVKAIKKPGLKIEDAFKQVRSSVKQQTGNKQVPWEASSLEGDFYFSGMADADTFRLDGLSEGSKERQAELERLKKLEADSAKQKEQEQAEIVKREKELAALDAQIVLMKSKLGTSAAGPNDSLKAMVAMVDKKEAEARRIEELKKQREAEEDARQTEIERLRNENEKNRKAVIEGDVTDYEKIAASPYGRDLSSQAWQTLASKYPEAQGLSEGDVLTLKRRLGLVRGFSGIPGKYTGIFYVGGMGGHFAKADVVIDAGSRSEPLKINRLDRIVIGDKISHPAQDVRIDVNDPDTLFWSTYKTDSNRKIHIGKSDLRTGSVIKDVSFDPAPRASGERPPLYKSSGQSKRNYLPVFMGQESYIDVVDKSSLENKNRLWISSLGYPKGSYKFAHGVNSPDMKTFVLAVNQARDGKGTGDIDLILLDLPSLENGSAKVLAKKTLSGEPDKTISFHQSFTNNGKYILQSVGDRVWMIDARTLNLVDEKTLPAGSQVHAIVPSADDRYAILSVRYVTEGRNSSGDTIRGLDVTDGGFMLYDLTSKSLHNKIVSACQSCHIGIGLGDKNAVLGGLDVTWN